jgi:hypothetical protein
MTTAVAAENSVEILRPNGVVFAFFAASRKPMERPDPEANTR